MNEDVSLNKKYKRDLRVYDKTVIKLVLLAFGFGTRIAGMSQQRRL